jgi:potassium efflux system protein
VLKAIGDFMSTPLTLGELSFFFSPLQALVRFVLPVLLLVLGYKLLLVLVRRLILKPLKAEEETKQKAYRWTRLAFRIVLLVALFTVIVGFFESEIPQYMAKIWEVLRAPLFTAGNSRISIITIILAIPVFYLASWLARITRRFVDGAVLNQLSIDEAMRFSISTLVRYLVLILGALIGLSLIGINLSSLAVLFGVLGIGVGFGLQSVVANFFAGLVIIFERPIKEGDRIVVNNLEGDVVQIRLRSTIINTLTNETIVVPNNQLVNNNIHNYSYKDKRIIVVNTVEVAYGTDLDRALTVLEEVARGNPHALKNQAPILRVNSFNSSGIELRLWTWIGNQTDKYAALSHNNLEIWRAFKNAGITIPFPQVDLHVREPVGHYVAEPPEAAPAPAPPPGSPPQTPPAPAKNEA